MHLLISHDFPAVPAGHAQEWSSSPSVQVPSCWHGLEAQSSGSYKKKHNWKYKAKMEGQGRDLAQFTILQIKENF